MISFTINYKNFRAKIDTYKKDNDFESMIRYAHTLKGLCGNIGAESLFDKAKDLEYFLKQTYGGECAQRDRSIY